MSRMRIDTLIDQLAAVRKKHGNLPLSTWDGFVQHVRIEPSTDGVLADPDTATELSLEIITEF